MPAALQISDIAIQIVRKDIKNVHLSVLPPDGAVRIAAPRRMSADAIRAFAISKLAWIRQRRKQLTSQTREPAREFLDRESHFVWGRRHLLTIVPAERSKQKVWLDHKRLCLAARSDSSQESRQALLHDWHRSLLHEAVPPLIAKWEGRLDVTVSAYFLQRMKTKWGSCNPTRRHIRLNTELVKKPRDLLEYVIIHEMAHLLSPRHDEKFFEILDRHYPTWREARQELNALPLAV